MQALITAGANANAQDVDDMTPLHLATERGYREIVQALIRAGADVNAQSTMHGVVRQIRFRAGHFFNEPENILNVRSLHYAAREGHLEIVQMLLAAGADVNVQDGQGWTPLHVAARNGHREMVQALIAVGADRTIRNRDGHTALDVALNQEVIDYLNNVPQLTEHLFEAAQHHDVAGMRDFMARGAALVARDAQGNNPLHYVIEDYDREHQTPLDEIVRELVHITGQRMVTIANNVGQTPLHVAAQQGNLWAAELLVRRGANVNIQDNHGDTPLHLANTREMCNKLLTRGANVSILNHEGANPITSNPPLWAGMLVNN